MTRDRTTKVPYRERRRLKVAAEMVRHRRLTTRRYVAGMPTPRTAEHETVLAWLRQHRRHLVFDEPAACPRSRWRCGVCKQVAYLCAVLADPIEDSAHDRFGRRIAGWVGAGIIWIYLFVTALHFTSEANQLDGPAGSFLWGIAGALAVGVLLVLPVATKELIEATPASGPGLPLWWDRAPHVRRRRLRRLLETVDAALNRDSPGTSE